MHMNFKETQLCPSMTIVGYRYEKQIVFALKENVWNDLARSLNIISGFCLMKIFERERQVFAVLPHIPLNF